MVRLLQVGFLLFVVALPAAGQASRSAESASLAARLQTVRRQGRDPESPARLRTSSRQSRLRGLRATLREGRRMGRRLRNGLGRTGRHPGVHGEEHGHRAEHREELSPALELRHRRERRHRDRLVALGVCRPRSSAARRSAQAGRYDDTLVRENGHWRFKRRVASNDTPPGPGRRHKLGEDDMRAYWLACPVFVTLFVVALAGQQPARIDDAALEERDGPATTG